MSPPDEAGAGFVSVADGDGDGEGVGAGDVGVAIAGACMPGRCAVFVFDPIEVSEGLACDAAESAAVADEAAAADAAEADEADAAAAIPLPVAAVAGKLDAPREETSPSALPAIDVGRASTNKGTAIPIAIATTAAAARYVRCDDLTRALGVVVWLAAPRGRSSGASRTVSCASGITVVMGASGAVTCAGAPMGCVVLSTTAGVS